MKRKVRTRKLGIKFKILIPVCVCVLVVCVVMGVNSYKHIQDGMVEMGVQEADMDGNPVQRALEGAAITVGNMPQTCIDAVYAGCLEKNAVTREEAKQIARAYLSENKKNYRDLFLEIIKAMEEDGFFDLSGITSSLNAMAENIEKQMAEENPEK